MTENANSDIPIATIAAIDIDLPCFFCGYNLRSLALDGTCPECGNPVQKCIRQGWLGFADPNWLARLRTGVTIILWTILAAVLCYVAFIALMITTSSDGGEPSVRIIQIAMLAGGLGFSSVWLWSVWLLTTAEPVTDRGDVRSKLGTWIRVNTALSRMALPLFFGPLWRCGIGSCAQG